MLTGRRLLVTGAASGIGQRIATLAAERGATPLLVDRNEAVLALAERLGGHGAVLDVTDEAAVAQVVAALAEGGFDGVVNAAGIVHGGTLAATSAAEWRRVLDVNLTGPFLICRAACPHLRPHASIVNIASAAGLMPGTAGSAYAASKAGLIMFSKALARELAPIRVNAVCPGSVETPMMDAVRRDHGQPSLDIYALRRIAQPDEIARAVLFLVGPDASYITGTALAVDGGRSFH